MQNSRGFYRREVDMKFIFLFITVLSLVGCAATTIKPSTLSDVSFPADYNARGKKIYLDFKKVNRYFGKDYDGSVPLTATKIQAIKELLIKKGFVLTQDRSSALNLKITEIYDDTPNATTGNISRFLLSSITASVIPYKMEYSYSFIYEVTNVHGETIGKVNNKIDVSELHGIASWVLDTTDGLLSKVWLEANEQALAELIEQGVL